MELRRRRDLGERMFQLLAYAHSAVETDGLPPSYGMIRDELGLESKGHVANIVRRLERRGLVNRVGDGRARRIRLC